MAILFRFESTAEVPAPLSTDPILVAAFVDAADGALKLKDHAGASTVVGGAAATAAAAPALAITGLFVNLGTTDPSAGGGVAATAPKIGIRLNGAATELWVKTSAPNTGWTKLALVA